MKFLEDTNSEAKLINLLADKSIQVIDDSAYPKLLLVEGTEEHIKDLSQLIGQLTYYPDKSYQIPETRKNIRIHK